MIRIFFPITVFVVVVCGEANNVCKTFDDYYTIKTNPNCYYNPAVDKSTGEMVEIFGYPFENHEVVNSGGYTLTLHRIPNTKHPKKKKNPIYLQHGIYTTSSGFVTSKNASFAFLLSDMGYDIWMGNFRGNSYSTKHNKLSISDPKYWDFGLDNTALEDLPKCLNYVAEVTNSTGRIIYIGHSMGTTAALMFASGKNEEAGRLVKLFILMAPAFTLHNIKTPIARFAVFSNQILSIIKGFEAITLVSRHDFFSKVYQTICLESPKLMQFCSSMGGLIFGPRTSVTMEMFPVLISSIFLGTSITTLKQVTDSTYFPTFRKLDLGFEENMKRYGKAIPPDYDLSKITVPFHVIAAPNDWLTAYEDAKILYYKHIPQSARNGFYTVPSLDFNHMDFLVGPTAKSFVYEHIFNLLKNVTGKDDIGSNFV